MNARAPLLFLLLFAGPAVAQDTPFGSQAPYPACLAAVEKDPKDGFERAMIWRDHGGGIPAEHCVAQALIALDEPEEGARRLDALARRPNAGTMAERAQLLSQAGEAWLGAGQAAPAESAFAAALKLRPRDGSLWINRARAKAMAENWAGAEADLTSALTFDNKNPQIRVLRAAARTALSRKADAKADIDAALRLDPTFPDALVERGAMKLAAGDKNGARTDWAAVLRRAPDSAAGDAARARIEELELRR